MTAFVIGLVTGILAGIVLTVAGPIYIAHKMVV